MALDFKGHFLYYGQVRRRQIVFKQSPEYRWYSAYQAYNRARNPEFKALWLKIMEQLLDGFADVIEKRGGKIVWEDK